MAFWSAAKNTEPRRNFKFLLSLNDLPVWVVKSVNLPTIEVGEAAHQFLNHTFYFPGTVKYNEITFTVVDAIDQDISSKMIQSFVKSGYNTPTTDVAAESSLITKEAAVNSALGAVTITHLGSEEDGGRGQLGYKLRGAWIKKIDFPQDLDYSNEDLSEITVTLRFDFFDFLENGSDPVTGFGG